MWSAVQQFAKNLILVLLMCLFNQLINYMR